MVTTRALFHFFFGGRGAGGEGWRGGIVAFGAYVYKLSQTLFSCLGSSPWVQTLYRAAQREFLDWTMKRMRGGGV